jgi:hypothetical protein
MESHIILSKLYFQYSNRKTLPNRNKNSKFQSLYSAIINNQVKNDQDALQLIYSDRNINAYRVLKSRFQKTIINEITNLNIKSKMVSQNSRIQQEILENQKLLSLINNSFNLKESQLILQLILKSSLKTGDVFLILDSSLKLYEYSKIWNKSSKDQEYYWNLILEHEKFLLEKIKVTKVYAYFINCISSNKNLTSLQIDSEIELILTEIVKSNTPDYFSKHKIYSSLYYYYFIKSNIPEIILVCENAIRYFKAKTNLNKFGYFSFVIKYSYVLMFLQQNIRAKKYFNMMLDKKISRKQTIWLNINMYAIKNLIYLSEYKEAMIKLIDVTRHHSFEKVRTPYFTEIFKIKEAYLNVLLKMNKFELENSSLLKKKAFRINKFLNEVPNYSKDKMGSNISILIIHIFYLLIDKNYDLILNRLEALKAYSHRYLRNDDSLRSNAFIKILLQLPAANYHPVALQRHAAKYYDKMINAPLHLAARHIEVEVIPYEKQYELLNDLLEMRLNKQI